MIRSLPSLLSSLMSERREARWLAVPTARALPLTLAALALCTGLLGGCNTRLRGSDDPGDSDLGLSDSDGGVVTTTPCDNANPCPRGQRCHQRACIPDNGPCCSDDECQNDTRCSSSRGPDGGACGVCIPFGGGEFDPMCSGQGFSAGEFKAPVDRCRWPQGARPAAANVAMTPLVIDLDGDSQPEIIFAPMSGSSTPQRLVAIRGQDCSVVYDVPANLQSFSQIAAADLDGDKRPEIVGVLAGAVAGGGRKVAIFNGQTGAQLAVSSADYQLTGTDFDCSGPAIADVDGDGKPEIIVGAAVLRWDKAAGRLDTLWSKPAAGGTWGTLTLVNDMDGDGKPEVIAGNRIYDGITGAEKTPPVMANLVLGGYAAIGDFNKDGSPDLVYIQSQRSNQQVAVVDVKNNAYLMNPTPVPGGWGGPPTVADFDGDGKPDFGTAGPRNYFVFSLDCLQNPKPAKCKGTLPGVLWQSATKDASSGGTASSVFDFNGDGRAEVVYRDECWLRVYDGVDGKTVFARPVTSGTALEMPVVADVDNDGHADLVVPSDDIQGTGYCSDQSPEKDTQMPHTGTTFGVFVLKDPMNRWVPSRGIWNQHAYHITNVADDGTVPARETPNWTSYNNYRQNMQGAAGMAPPQGDVTGKGAAGLDQGDCVKVQRLFAQVCNRGAAPLGANLPSTFYRMDPRAGMPPMNKICTAYTKAALTPGRCEVVSCEWMNPPTGAQDLWLRVNDDGALPRVVPECKGGNDMAYLPGVKCGYIPG